MNEPTTPVVHLLGIRHHGPGSARSVLAALAVIQPSIVLVEAPADVQSTLSWIGHPELLAPVALLGYVVAQPARAIFAPFASFSPEWQGIAWANERGIEVRAIDLPLTNTFADAARDEAPTLGQDVAKDAVVDRAPPDPLRALAAWVLKWVRKHARPCSCMLALPRMRAYSRGRARRPAPKREFSARVVCPAAQ